jgi:hypothetical protein
VIYVNHLSAPCQALSRFNTLIVDAQPDIIAVAIDFVVSSRGRSLPVRCRIAGTSLFGLQID